MRLAVQMTRKDNTHVKFAPKRSGRETACWCTWESTPEKSRTTVTFVTKRSEGFADSRDIYCITWSNISGHTFCSEKLRHMCWISASFGWNLMFGGTPVGRTFWTGLGVWQCFETTVSFPNKTGHRGNIEEKWCMCRNMPDEKEQNCILCDKTFRNKSVLGRHMLIHTGEKPFECSFCDERFRQIATRNRHILRHTGEKPYKCNVCQRSFSRKSTLVNHVKTHTGEKPF